MLLSRERLGRISPKSHLFRLSIVLLAGENLFIISFQYLLSITDFFSSLLIQDARGDFRSSDQAGTKSDGEISLTECSGSKLEGGSNLEQTSITGIIEN